MSDLTKKFFEKDTEENTPEEVVKKYEKMAEDLQKPWNDPSQPYLNSVFKGLFDLMTPAGSVDKLLFGVATEKNFSLYLRAQAFIPLAIKYGFYTYLATDYLISSL